MPDRAKPLTLEEMEAAADQFFPLFTVVHSRMPEGATTEDTLKVMETVAKLGHKLRADSKVKLKTFGFNDSESKND